MNRSELRIEINLAKVKARGMISGTMKRFSKGRKDRDGQTPPWRIRFFWSGGYFGDVINRSELSRNPKARPKFAPLDLGIKKLKRECARAA